MLGLMLTRVGGSSRPKKPSVEYDPIVLWKADARATIYLSGTRWASSQWFVYL
jgi:hypothetical protein